MELYSNKLEGNLIRSKVQILQESEKPTRYFLKHEQHQATSSTISYLQVDGKNITDTEEIIKESTKFYSKLYQSEPIDKPLLDYFLQNLPSLEEEKKSLCEGPITLNECKQALLAMGSNKSPGLDGLPMEFYSKFFYLIGSIYVEIINQCFNEFKQPVSQKQGIIKLICKDKTQPELLKNWRPISLLNVDYKIITKILTTRLSKVIESLVHVDQSSSVPGRSILDNLHLTRNLMDYLDFKKLPGILISLDQEKAFDRVSHQYLFSVLKKVRIWTRFSEMD